MQTADAFAEVPLISDPGYLERTLEIAQEHQAGLVIPTLDPELAPFASVKDDWAVAGVHVSVPSPDLVRHCRDKRLTATFFESLGIPPLRELDDGFPRFIKPIAGGLSGDTHVVHLPDELPARVTDRAQYVHQELVDAKLYSEFTVDALYTRAGDLVCAVPRRRIEVRSGEISKGRTEKGPVLDTVRTLMARVPGAYGCLCMQFFHSPDVQERPLIGIEVNARFGGGFPMSNAAGGRLAQWLVEEIFMGRESSYREDWKDGLTFLRFDEQVMVRA